VIGRVDERGGAAAARAAPACARFAAGSRVGARYALLDARRETRRGCGQSGGEAADGHAPGDLT
jgi:hypothetical protein